MDNNSNTIQQARRNSIKNARISAGIVVCITIFSEYLEKFDNNMGVGYFIVLCVLPIIVISSIISLIFLIKSRTKDYPTLAIILAPIIYYVFFSTRIIASYEISKFISVFAIIYILEIAIYLMAYRKESEHFPIKTYLPSILLTIIAIFVIGALY